ncbi:MAG TPA: copper-binding protein [Phycisphaerales bacterium]|nr:copper-binding protein [Phycisphaerales bacterium]
MCPRTAPLLTALALVATLAACDRPVATPPAKPFYGKMEVVTPATSPEQSYTVRAVVMGLPASGRAYLELHHEEIPHFVGRDGSVEGMKEMIMDFPAIRPDVDLSALAIGDKVEATFEVRWKSEPRTVVTKIAKLPESTALNLKDVTDPGK